LVENPLRGLKAKMLCFERRHKSLMRKLCVAACLLLLSPAVSQAKSLEDLLVEKGVITKGEAARTASSGASKVYWNDGTRVDFPDAGFNAGISTLIQTRYTFTDSDEEAGGKNTSSFSVERARVILSGTALHEEFSYYLQGDFVGSGEVTDKTAGLKDAYLKWHPCDYASLKMGQFKTGFSRQFLASDEKLQFADRSIASDAFDFDRNQGLAGTWALADGMVVLGAQIFNGISDGEGINSVGVDTKHLGVVNARANVMGKMDVYEEGDIGMTRDPAVSVGLAAAFSQSANNSGGVTQDRDITGINADATFKYQGISVAGEFYWTQIDPDIGDESEPLGFYVQGGYFLTPKKLEVAARYSQIDCDDGSAGGICTGSDSINGVSVGLNYYFWEHNLKAQLNYEFLQQDTLGAGTDDVNTNRWLLQLSSYF
jgi:phosphate-selective porin OprO and OprP